MTKRTAQIANNYWCGRNAPVTMRLRTAASTPHAAKHNLIITNRFAAKCLTNCRRIAVEDSAVFSLPTNETSNFLFITRRCSFVDCVSFCKRAGQRYPATQPSVSRRSLHRFDIYAGQRNQFNSRPELQRNDRQQRLRPTALCRRWRERGDDQSRDRVEQCLRT